MILLVHQNKNKKFKKNINQELNENWHLLLRNGAKLKHFKSEQITHECI